MSLRARCRRVHNRYVKVTPVCTSYGPNLTLWVQPTGPIEATLCDYETIESVNGELFDQLHTLVQTPFFKYFRVSRSLYTRQATP